MTFNFLRQVTSFIVMAFLFFQSVAFATTDTTIEGEFTSLKSYAEQSPKKITHSEALLRNILLKYTVKKKESEINPALLERRNALVKLWLDLPEASPHKLLKVIIELSYAVPQPNTLIEMAHKKGAEFDDSILALTVSNIIFAPGVIETLFNNGHANASPERFCHYLQVYGKSRCEIDDLGQTNPNSSEFFRDPYKNLYAKPASTPKIPRVLHHIWLTNAEQHREISEEDIKNLKKTKELFASAKFHEDVCSADEWQHIVWTNNESLFIDSVQKLKQAGILVKNISEIKTESKLWKIIQNLINESRWGMAADALRYYLVYQQGGVYADLDFVFARNVEDEIYTYDYLVRSGDANSFFMAKPQHPILGKALELVERNFERPPEYITALGYTGSNMVTFWRTVMPLHVAYATTANKDGNVDVKYPFDSVDWKLLPDYSDTETALLKYLPCENDAKFYMPKSILEYAFAEAHYLPTCFDQEYEFELMSKLDEQKPSGRKILYLGLEDGVIQYKVYEYGNVIFSGDLKAHDLRIAESMMPISNDLQKFEKIRKFILKTTSSKHHTHYSRFYIGDDGGESGTWRDAKLDA